EPLSVFRGALDLDELAGGGVGDVHVDFGAGVVGIVQIQADLALHDANADGGELVNQRLRRFVEGRIVAGWKNGGGRWGAGRGAGYVSGEFSNGVDKGDVSARDGRCAGPAVGLEDLAINGDGVGTDFGEVDGGAEGAADQALDFGATGVGMSDFW